MKNNKDSFLKKIIWAFFLIALLPSLFYVYFFHNSTISSTTSDWANFATYFGSLLQTIIASLNILVLYRLTKVANSIADRQHDESLTLQKKVLITQLRSAAIEKITSDINFFQNAFKNEDFLQHDIITLQMNIISFAEHYEHLFPEIKQKSPELIKTLVSIVNIFKGVTKESAREVTKEITNKLITFREQSDEFIKYLHQVTIAELN